MVVKAVFFHGTTFLLGRLLCTCCVLFGDRTRNDSRVGRDLYRTRVLAPGDVTLSFSVRLAPFMTLTEFFSAQWRGVNISSIVSFNSYQRGVYDIHCSFGTQFFCPQERLFCVPTRSDCARVLQIWGFLYCQFIISNTLAQLLSRHFRLLWTLLQGAHSLDIGFSPDLWKTGCVLHFRHTCSFVGGSRVSILGPFVSLLNSIRAVSCAAHPGGIVVRSL
jgi:hypothetical protein